MSNDILLHNEEDTLVITIETALPNEKATATIISQTGETVENFKLNRGINNIEVTMYKNKNYSIRIKSGNNILVQKI